MKSREKDSLRKFVTVVADLLRGRGQTWRSIAKTCGVERNAAAERIKLLEQLPGVRRVRFDADNRSSKLIFEATALPGMPVPLAYAACIAASFSWVLSGTSYEKHTRDARSLLLLRAGVKDVEDFDRKFLFVARGGEKAFPDRERELDAVVKALIANRALQFKYRHLDGRMEVVNAQPLSLALHQHQFYLIARASANARPYPFRFARLEKVSLKKKFAYPSDQEYAPATLLKESIGIFLTDDNPVEDVVLRLSSEWMRFADTHRWHPEQRIDGETLRLRVRVCPELVSWILSKGAVVMAPDRLRVEVRRRLVSALNGYTPRRRRAGPTIATAMRQAAPADDPPPKKSSTPKFGA